MDGKKNLTWVATMGTHEDKRTRGQERTKKKGTLGPFLL